MLFGRNIIRMMPIPQSSELNFGSFEKLPTPGGISRSRKCANTGKDNVTRKNRSYYTVCDFVEVFFVPTRVFYSIKFHLYGPTSTVKADNQNRMTKKQKKKGSLAIFVIIVIMFFLPRRFSIFVGSIIIIFTVKIVPL